MPSRADPASPTRNVVTIMFSAGPLWVPTGEIPTLSEGQVHVWRASLDEGCTHVRQLAQVLCDGERARAERFFFARDRHRFIVRRSILRVILGGYLHIAPDQVRLRYGRRGKPCLAEGTLRFNLSHSGDTALFAFARGREVGVDVERIQAGFPWDEITEHIFSPQESGLLQRLQGADRRRTLFVAWTCKEAYVKARGHGLSFPLDRVDMALSPPTLRRVGEDKREASRWSLQELGVGEDYAAALAVEGHDWRLVCRQWRWIEAE
jgi:4'-phosphopantetheinyl transferase